MRGNRLAVRLQPHLGAMAAAKSRGYTVKTTLAGPSLAAAPGLADGDLQAEAPGQLPFQRRDLRAGGGRALRIADYIAGMTDRYAITEHTRLFGSTPELR